MMGQPIIRQTIFRALWVMGYVLGYIAHNMLAALPVLALGALFLCWVARMGQWRVGALAAAICWGGFVWGITQLTSGLRLYAQTPAALCWLALDLALVAVCAGAIHRKGLPALGLAGLGWMERLLLLGVAGMVGITGFVALVSAPANYDSLTYHMTRVAHWAQNGSVAFYPTGIDRQNFLEPLAEYVIGQFYLLANGDALANISQWLAFIGCVVGASVLAQQVGGGRRAQILAAVFAATAPMAILQASSTQNDLVASFWLVCVAVFALRIMHPAPANLRPARADVILFGLSLGLALLTKATLRLYALPLVMWVSIWMLLRVRAKAILPLAAIAGIVIGINVAFVLSNFAAYGPSLMPSSRVGTLTNAAISPGIVLSNILRNAALHFGLPRADLNKQLIVQPITALHAALGLDVSDPRSTHEGSRFAISDVPFTEDSSGSPLHLLLIWAAMLAAVLRPALRKNIWLMGLGLAALAGFVLFCAVLRWQPWHTRLHLPLFILFAPFVALAADEALPRRFAPLVFAGLIVAAYPFITQNAFRPLTGPRSVLRVPRSEQYFTQADALRKPYQAAVAEIAAGECRSIGLITQSDTPEYLLWILMQVESPSTQMQHVLVKDKSARLAEPLAPPCAVLATEPAQNPISLNGQMFEQRQRWGGVGLYLP
ncbi:MAG TPA: hypothetical protein PL141_07450 [Thermoflexales bacterium]|nr:hypothetical protein [Thermoflexales bacterium]